MDLVSEQIGALNVITVNEARIDAAVAIQFKDAMRRLTANGTTHVLLNLSQVLFVDSSGLGAIVGAMKQMGSERRLDLVGLTADVDNVFRMTRMDTIFDIHDTMETAIGRAAG